MIMASITATIGMGLISTWTVNSTFSQWFGYQAMTGLGIGMGMQQPMIAVQTVLPINDVPVGTSIIVFMQTLGAAVFISVAQSVFQNQLLKSLQASVPGVNAEMILHIGATDIWSEVPPQIRPAVLVAYNQALTKAYTVATAMMALTILGSLSIEWKSVRKDKKPKAKDAEKAVTPNGTVQTPEVES